jgi:AraC-like DNA-binding protein
MFEARTGGVILTEPGEFHAVRSMEHPATHYWFIEIDPKLVRRAASETGLRGSPHIRTPMSLSPHLFEALSRLYRAVRSERSPLEQEIRFNQFVRLMITEACEGAGPYRDSAIPPGIARARDYLHAHSCEAVRLDELASVAGVTLFHLVHAFTRAFGVPPHAYQNHLRLAAARTQLQQGVPARHIDVGFADQAHLTHHFKRAFGITPGRYGRVLEPRRRSFA